MPNPYSTPTSNLQRDLNDDQNDTSSPFSAKGRFGRLSYLAWYLLTTIVTFVIAGIVMALTGAATGVLTASDPDAILSFYTSGAGIAVLAVMLASLVINLIFFIRRLHDINMSGWFSLLFLIPLVNLIFGIYALAKKGTEGANRFGSTRATPKWEKIVGIIALIILVLYLIVILAAIIAPIMLSSMS
ncbi:MAG: DUF805 domain-containing protein [Cocleimonas sp.]|nr:DUF805 domain-containing protein [Cocleimonas sp.]